MSEIENNSGDISSLIDQVIEDLKHLKDSKEGSTSTITRYYYD